MPKFLGIDCCTRKMNALVIDTDRRTLSPTISVYYSDLRPQSEIKNGMVPNEDPLVKHSDPLVWADALDTLLGRLTEAGIDLSTISAISGCAQQHGTVYLSPDFAKNNWISGKTSSLAEAVAPMLTRKSSPIWMDSSTFQQCREIEAALRGSPDTQVLPGRLQRIREDGRHSPGQLLPHLSPDGQVRED